jgi:membrane protein DedA with SNARE-associated domain/membrane-associated phospholipid phosphatase
VSAGQIVAAVVAALLLAGAVHRRGRMSRERMLLSIAGALALGVYASGVLSELPDPETAIEDLAQALGAWTYALVGAMAFLETGAFVGLVAPGEFTVIIGGVIAGQGEIEVIPLLGLVWACCFLGDTTSFVIGRKLGRAWLVRHGHRVLITPERLRQVEGYFDRHGGKTVLIGRFIGLVRALAPFVAGSSGMRYARFAPFSIVGTGLWAATFTLLGFFFWRSFGEVADIAGQATFAFGVVVGTVVGVVWAARRLRRPEDRRRLREWAERQGRRPLLRPLAAALRPVWRYLLRPAWRLSMPRLRFLWRRLTPGELGIELTTAIAVAAVGLYVFGAYAIDLADEPRVTAADREVLELTRDVREDAGVDAARELTKLGDTGVVVALIGLSSILLALRRRPVELGALVLGFAALYGAVQLTKAGIDRPRPPNGLEGTRGSSFPSGHAAYSTVYVAMAVIASRVLRGVIGRAALITTGIALAAVIGLTRIHLIAHYWSDVLGGWGLGLGLFGVAAIVTLVVDFVRKNEPSPPEADSASAEARREAAADRA